MRSYLATAGEEVQQQQPDCAPACSNRRFRRLRLRHGGAPQSHQLPTPPFWDLFVPLRHSRAGNPQPLR